MKPNTKRLRPSLRGNNFRKTQRGRRAKPEHPYTKFLNDQLANSWARHIGSSINLAKHKKIKRANRLKSFRNKIDQFPWDPILWSLQSINT